MERLFEMLFGLIFAVTVIVVVSIAIVALFRPSLLPDLVKAYQTIALALVRKLPEPPSGEKRKNDDDDYPDV